MTLSVKQGIKTQATELLNCFQQAKRTIDSLHPLDQIAALTGLQSEIHALTELQKKVNSIALGQIPMIERFTQEELEELSQELTASADILEELDENTLVATACVDIASCVEKLFQTPNINDAKSLQTRIAILKTDHPFLNQWNRKSLEASEQCLQTLLNPSAQQVPNRRSPSPVSSDNQKIREEQDENYQASLFNDKYQQLNQNWTGNVAEDFEKALTYYKEIKTYSLSKPSYLSNTACQAISGLIELVEITITDFISTQATQDSLQVQQDQSKTTEGLALRKFKSLIEQAISTSSDVSPFILKINKAYEELSSDERASIFDALSLILKEEGVIKKDLGVGLRRLPFASITGSLIQKKKALEKILPAENLQTAQSTAPAKLSEEMHRRFDAIKEQVPPVVSITLPSQMHVPGKFDSMYLPDDVSIDSLKFEDVVPEQNRAIQPHTTSQNLSIIHDLLTILQHLGPNASSVQLQQACEALMIMDSKGFESTSDRPRFHLYYIHKNESPEKLKNDRRYGNKAFAGEYPATNEERSRAVQRTIIEVGLDKLKDAINFDDWTSLTQLLDLLEKVKLHANDRSEGQENAAYNLYSAFYHLHVNARTNNPSLIDPHDPRFNGDFGRVAFPQAIHGVDPAIKIAAIEQVLNRFKRAWKL